MIYCRCVNNMESIKGDFNLFMHFIKCNVLWAYFIFGIWSCLSSLGKYIIKSLFLSSFASLSKAGLGVFFYLLIIRIKLQGTFRLTFEREKPSAWVWLMWWKLQAVHLFFDNIKINMIGVEFKTEMEFLEILSCKNHQRKFTQVNERGFEWNLL